MNTTQKMKILDQSLHSKSGARVDSVTTHSVASSVEIADWPHPDPPLVTILFARHHGRTYPQAVATAQQARVYHEQGEGSGRSTTSPCSPARRGRRMRRVRCCGLTADLKGTIVFDGDGAMVPNTWTAGQVLTCYRQARLCADHRAYCHVVINDPFTHRGAFGVRDAHDPEADRWLLPCHRISASYSTFHAHHPASATTLIQEAAVRNGSQSCPNFDAAAFRAVVGDVAGDGTVEAELGTSTSLSKG